ncbi:hypothetical protein Corgl_1540 [Coriobacterium glomerans PW2]|uniref:Uncharacterized protein n=1 Tax=Coriobacterium glomerans (strain ATCC 49209 / DSM 20642 / JCM 10262 / PW2) TaxID=700015 RepID=F2NAW1_CORGP|nr:hypothetical protein [Coriobacterium glomerans]AEB07639.1 hypothetical protein Corgl_1540 [Coriobacterium glomerans PW2]
MNTLTIGCVILLVVYFIGSEMAKRYLYRSFEVSFMSERYDECIHLLDGVPMRILFPRFNLFFMRMNVCMAKAEMSDVDYMIDRLLTAHFTRAQRRAVISRALVFFEQSGCAERAAAMRREQEKLDIADKSKQR